MNLLLSPPKRAPLPFAELRIVASFVYYGRFTYSTVFGYAKSIEARSFNKMGFPSSSGDPTVLSNSSEMLTSPIKKAKATKGGVEMWYGAGRVAP